MTLTPISGPDAVRLMDQGAMLVDVRTADERASVRIPGSLHIPLGPLPEGIARRGTPAVIFYCRTGFRTEVNGPRLADAAGAPAYMLDGGLDAWRRAGLSVEVNAADVPKGQARGRPDPPRIRLSARPEVQPAPHRRQPSADDRRPGALASAWS